MSGNNRNEERLLKQIKALSFAQYELILFLDTHPDDKKALMSYHEITAELDGLRKFYRENFGPLTPAEVNSTTDWTWVCGPWPWEN